MDETYIDIKDVMRLTSLSRTSIWRHRRAGMFPAPKVFTPRIHKWPKSQILKWLEELPTAAVMA